MSTSCRCSTLVSVSPASAGTSGVVVSRLQVYTSVVNFQKSPSTAVALRPPKTYMSVPTMAAPWNQRGVGARSASRDTFTSFQRLKSRS
uniref:Uncharacterized protein n=1 Tax=Ixodes ricinus TaxID=34613 RepID=A0A6B0UBD5_IXORI